MADSSYCSSYQIKSIFSTLLQPNLASLLQPALIFLSSFFCCCLLLHFPFLVSSDCPLYVWNWCRFFQGCKVQHWSMIKTNHPAYCPPPPRKAFCTTSKTARFKGSGSQTWKEPEAESSRVWVTYSDGTILKNLRDMFRDVTWLGQAVQLNQRQKESAAIIHYSTKKSKNKVKKSQDKKIPE